jgi:hypothetical protein
LQSPVHNRRARDRTVLFQRKQGGLLGALGTYGQDASHILPHIIARPKRKRGCLTHAVIGVIERLKERLMSVAILEGA